MTRLGGWIPVLIAAVALTAISGRANADAGDMSACAAVTSSVVRLACFDAAAKDVAEGDVATCAKISSGTVRLACFDAASGHEAPGRGAPAASTDGEMARLKEQMRAREAAMNARIQELQRKAAAVERRAAEIERRTASVKAGKAEGANPEEAFGSKYIAEKSEQTRKEEFGDPKAEYDDPLTAEHYGKKARDKKRKDPKRINKIIAKITHIKQNRWGKVTVTLENGQVWRQIDSEYVRWKRHGENVAKIRRALMGSFLMTINDRGAALRVRRIK